jgi:hypothetical protein
MRKHNLKFSEVELVDAVVYLVVEVKNNRKFLFNTIQFFLPHKVQKEI